MNNFYKDKQDIITWLDKYQIKNYDLIPDDKYSFLINVNGNVDLFSKFLRVIPVKFNTVHGNLSIRDNWIEDLEFCPEMVGGDFLCYDNKIKSLKCSPRNIKGNFSCRNNILESLEYCPDAVGGDFDCSLNHIKSFEFCPETVGGKFLCHQNSFLWNFKKVNDFNLIYVEHKKLSSIKLAKKIEEELNLKEIKPIKQMKL